MTGFLGRYEHQLDEKGRVSLPAEYRRKADGTRFVLLQWQPTHLTLFPEDRWSHVQAHLLELRKQRPELAGHLRDLTSRATDVEPDKQGRILIPGWLKERVGLDGGVMLVGAMDRVEIWNLELFREHHPDDRAPEPERVAEMHAVLG